MPFTLSHPAAILPFVRMPLLPAGLVIGSMVPDLPYFVPIGLSREYTHSVVGAVTADLPMGIVCFLLWSFVLRSPLLDFAPGWLRGRMAATATATGRPVLALAALLIGSLLVGIATHLAWDSFTHPDGWAAVNVAFFQNRLGPFTVYRWAQYASSVIGLAIISAWATRWVRRTPPVPTIYRRTTRVGRRIAWIAVGGVLILVAAATWIHGLIGGLEPLDRSLVYGTAVFSLAISGAVGLLISLGWYLVPKREAIEA